MQAEQNLLRMRTLGDQVKAFRVAREWTTKRLADEVGTSRQNIESLEAHGNRIPKYLAVLAKVMGTSVDRMMEEAGLGHGSLEAKAPAVQASFSGVTGSSVTPVPQAQVDSLAAQTIVIPQYEVAGAMGNGLVLEPEPPGIIRSWNVSSDWLRRNIAYCSSYQNLTIVTGYGNSMSDLYGPGDPLICDIGHTTVDADGVYFFRIDEFGYIKMLQRIPTADGTILRARSKNPDYEPFDITPAMADRFQVFGRILKAWKGELL